MPKKLIQIATPQNLEKFSACSGVGRRSFEDAVEMLSDYSIEGELNHFLLFSRTNIGSLFPRYLYSIKINTDYGSSSSKKTDTNLAIRDLESMARSYVSGYNEPYLALTYPEDVELVTKVFEELGCLVEEISLIEKY